MSAIISEKSYLAKSLRGLLFGEKSVFCLSNYIWKFMDFAFIISIFLASKAIFLLNRIRKNNMFF